MTKANLNLTFKEIEAARLRIAAVLPRTPLIQSQALSVVSGKDVYLKLDNRFITGSFKERGTCNFLLQMNEETRKAGVCAASAGNHAMALSFHAARLATPCTIVMPTNAALVKIEASRKNGARVILEGKTFDEAYNFALNHAQEKKLTYVPAFDHPWIVAGQGTCGLELLEQLPDLDAVVVPLGGGGLISGIALAIKEKRPGALIIGAESEWTHLRRSQGYEQKNGLISVSIADGIAMKRAGEITGPIIAAKVDQTEIVTEDQIAAAVVKMLEVERIVVEGAAAAAVAALLTNKLPKSAKKVILLISGSNIDINVLSRLILRDMAQRDRLIRLRVSVPDKPGSLNFATKIVADSGANVLEVVHERLFTSVPGNVDITLIVEIRNQEHKIHLLQQLKQTGVEVLPG